MPIIHSTSEWRSLREEEYRELCKKRKAISEELSRINERLKEINKHLSYRDFKSGDKIYYFYISRETHMFELSEMTYQGYPSQHKILKSGCYFLSEAEVTQFVDDMEQSLFNIANNRKHEK
jgi:hypothetical protein